MLGIDWGSVLTNVLNAILPLLAASGAAWFAAKARESWLTASAQNKDVMNIVHDAAKAGAIAAEQAGAGELIKDKKVYALQIAQTWLANYGLTVDLELVDAAVEQAVKENFNWDHTFPDPIPDEAQG